MKTFISWLVIAGLVVGLSFILKTYLVIHQVSCRLNEQIMESQAAVCQQLQALRGTTLLFRDLQGDPQVASLLYLADTKEAFGLQRVEKSLAGKVVFFLEDQAPLFRIEQGTEVFLVTASGFLQKNNTQLQVPLVKDPHQLYQDQPARVNLFLATLLEQLSDHGEQIEQIILISPSRIEIAVSQFPKIIVELTQSPLQLANRLKLILEKLKPQEIDLNLQEIDLRFELPVMRTYESSSGAQVLIDS